LEYLIDPVFWLSMGVNGDAQAFDSTLQGEQP
jgi:hypothetical protein